MGGFWSFKRPKTPSIPNPVNSRRYTQELISHLAQCRPISTLADGMEVVSRREITDRLLDMNEEAGDDILEARNPALFGLHKDYSQCSLMTLESYASLTRWVEKERDLQQAALKELSDAQMEMYAHQLDGLGRRFRETNDSFTDEISTKFQAVYTQQIKTIETLQQQKQKFHKKLKFTKAWKKVSRAISVSAFAAVMVCSVVAAVVASPPVAAAVVIATALPLGSFGRWIDSRLKKRERALKREMEAMGAMLAGSRIAIKDLDRIKAMIDGLEVQIHSLMLNPESAISVEEGVDVVKMLQGLMTNMEELGEEAERCCKDTRRASTVVLQRIFNTLVD